ncbi:MAG: 30S ribosomal protein S8 [Candidatus Hydrogenedentes bacterium]|nr:30S ribosomal protein S8 [Candidatus Hydrogenedentota bacterium]
MSMSDPIADLLTRVRNAAQARQATVDVPSSKLKAEICRVLKEEGYISEYTIVAEPLPGSIRIHLKYARDRRSVVQGLKRVSKPSLRVYVGSQEIKPVCSGLGISILSTSEGVMTGKKARNAKVGGEVICEVW